MKANLKTLLTVAGLSLATLSAATAIAQPGPGRGPGAGLTATQPQGHALERFQAADANKDGFLTKEEADKGMPGMASRFAAIDTNQDGKLTSDEFQAMRGNMRGKGRPQGAGPQAASSGPLQGMGPGSRMGGGSSGMQRTGMRAQGGLCINADTDKDGFVSRAEAEKLNRPNALSRFDALDTNKDGKLSTEERATCPAIARR
ncbi:hypothetical protein GCM10027046_16430 [Uliginosibacterium flavum]|uniref:EF-hand domain-containing protein n=1 Tax=Uliginosibacterium flavum TaxID=1396831 RepID=A0ABV2TP33_9RHOO